MNQQNLFIDVGHPNRPGTKLDKFLAIVIHYTANPKPEATASMNAKYFNRKWVKGLDGKPYEVNGKVPFAYGSAQVIADDTGIVFALPPDETAWACGDSKVILPSGKMGQQPIAKTLFQNRQNHYITSVEICNNRNWDLAVENAGNWIAGYLKSLNLHIDLTGSLDPQNILSLAAENILILRHYDLTGKTCPKPFIDNFPAWTTFVTNLAHKVADNSDFSSLPIEF